MCGGQVLIVEDDVDVREAMRDVLESEGFRVQTAQNGKEALGFLQKKLPCLVITDLMMPIMDGWHLVQTLHSDKRFQNVPIIVVTAGHTKCPPGVEALMEKPVPVRPLLSKVSQFC